MKTLFGLFTAFLFVFFLGCQESSITDPGTVNDNAFSQQQVQDPSYKDLLSYYPSVLEIPKSVFDPTHPQIHGTKITGFIRYDLQQLPVFTAQERPRYEVLAKFWVNLQLNSNCPFQDKPMKVVGFASQQLDIPYTETNAPQIVTKEFNVSDACCGCLKMVLKFAVYQKEVSLYSMQLVKINRLQPVGDPES